MIESRDYELIPLDDDTETWSIRILTGDFVETVIRYGKLKIVGENLTFNFDIEYTPDSSVTEENEDLQKVVGKVLYDILDRIANEIPTK